MRHVIGIDGGGTHSTAQLQGIDSPACAQITVGSVNICSNSLEFVRDQLQRAFSELWILSGSSPRELRAVCVGSAGILSRKSQAMLREVILSIVGEGIPLKVTDDMETCLAGALAGSTGIALMSGTGSFCIGRDERGRLIRVGGVGHILGDEGSAYDIGRAILIAAVHAWDGRGRATLLTALLKEARALGSISDIVDYVYLSAKNKGDIAALSPLLEAALEKGDIVARQIHEETAAKLVSLVKHVKRKFSADLAEIALSGGVLKNCQSLRRRAIQMLSDSFPGACIHAAHADAIQGAVRLATALAEQNKAASSTISP